MAWAGRGILKNATRTTMAVPAPEGISTGDSFVLVPFVAKSGVTIASAKGSTLVATKVLTAVGNIAAFGIEHDGSATYEITWGGASTECSAATFGFTGRSASFLAGSTATATSTNPKAPPVEPAKNGYDLLDMAIEGSALAATPPSGMTERLDGTGSEGSIFGFHAATQDNISSGSTGEKTTTLASSTWISFLIAIAPKAEGETIYEEGTLSGSLTITGSLSDAAEATESLGGSLNITGSMEDAQEATESVSGTLTLTGSLTDGLEYTEVAEGSISVTGSVSDAVEFVEQAEGVISVTGLLTDLQEFTDAVSGSALLIGILSGETYEVEGEEEETTTYILQPLGPFHRTQEEPTPEELSLFARFLNLFRKEE